MNQADFSVMLSESFERITSILDAKSAEYSKDKDKLHNFIKASHLTGETVNQAIAGMLVKHVVSIFDMIEDEGEYSLDRWDEKLFDTLNYLLLLRASVIDGLPMNNPDPPIAPPSGFHFGSAVPHTTTDPTFDPVSTISQGVI